MIRPWWIIIALAMIVGGTTPAFAQSTTSVEPTAGDAYVPDVATVERISAALARQAAFKMPAGPPRFYAIVVRQAPPFSEIIKNWDLSITPIVPVVGIAGSMASGGVGFDPVQLVKNAIRSYREHKIRQRIDEELKVLGGDVR